MEFKEEVKKDLNKYFEKFEKYDNELIPEIENKISANKVKFEEFEQKWSGEIFPTDIQVKDDEEKALNNEKNKLDEQKEKLENDVKNIEDELKGELYSIKGKIHSRMNELVRFTQNKENYISEKEKLTKELENQLEGIKTWEKNGVSENDVLYQKRKNEIIPKLENDINELNKKLDENAIKEEWKNLKELDTKINGIVVHDKKYMVPELKELFGFEEKSKVNEETINEQENTPSEEDLEGSVNKLFNRVKNVIPRKQKTNENVVNNVEKEEIENTVDNTKKEENVANNTEKENKPKQKLQMVIGRKINLLDENGNIKMSINSKDYFKYIKDRDTDILNEKFSEVINDDSKIFNVKLRSIGIDKLDPIVKFAFLNGLKNEVLDTYNVLKVTAAIVREDKNVINETLPIKWDKNDLSKGAFLPWNRKQRDEMASLADKSANIMEVVGEYEPNPFKRFFGRIKQPLLAKKEVKQLESGEKQQDTEETKKEDKERNNKLSEKMNNFRNKLSEKALNIENNTSHEYDVNSQDKNKEVKNQDEQTEEDNERDR